MACDFLDHNALLSWGRYHLYPAHVGDTFLRYVCNHLHNVTDDAVFPPPSKLRNSFWFWFSLALNINVYVIWCLFTASVSDWYLTFEIIVSRCLFRQKWTFPISVFEDLIFPSPATWFPFREFLWNFSITVKRLEGTQYEVVFSLLSWWSFAVYFISNK